jgi:hypothetical protein
MEIGTSTWRRFVRECKLRSVRVTKDALRDAQTYFGFLSEEDLVFFIGRENLEEVAFIDTKPLEFNFTGVPIDVHAYRFLVGKKEGYLAFYFGDPRVVLKSFKPDRFPPQRSPATRLIGR